MKPMTAPPRKASGSASRAPPVWAAWAVRALAIVATVMPTNPARAESTAPVT